MNTGRNESKTLTKHILCECKSKFDGTKCNSDQWWNNDKLTVNCDEVIESYDEKTNCKVKQVICKTHNFFNLLAFFLITIALLITVRINCYLIKYRVKNLLSFHNTNNKLNKFCIDSIN